MFPDQGAGDEELEGKGHDEVVGDVLDPHNRHLAPQTGMEGHLTGTVQGHENHHTYHHAPGDGKNLLQRLILGRNQEAEGKALSWNCTNSDFEFMQINNIESAFTMALLPWYNTSEFTNARF